MTPTNNRILLVEDDQNFGDVLRSYLEMHDYDVTLATDGVAGWESFRRGNYDLCLFDVMMPRKDGFSLAKDSKRITTPNMPIIFSDGQGYERGCFAKGSKVVRTIISLSLSTTDQS